MGGPRWTKKEIGDLYKFASLCSQKEAARRLGRSAVAISLKAYQLGIVWRQGCYNTQQIADEVGCSQSAVSRLVHILYDGGDLVLSGSKASVRYNLNEQQYERLVHVLTQTRKYRTRYVAAARVKHQKRKERLSNG